MATAPPALHLRPLSVGESLDAAFRLYGARFRTLVRCVLAVAVPMAIIDTLVQAATLDRAFTDSPASRSEGVPVAGAVVSVVLNVVVVSLATAACVRVVGAVYLGEAADWRSSLRFGFARLAPVIGASLLIGVGVIAGLFALVIPGIWLAVRWSLADAAIVIERVGALAGMARSYALVEGHWWRCFAAIAAMYLVAGLLTTVLSGVVQGVVFGASDSETLNAVIATLANVVALAVATPLQAAIVAVVYFDLRVRKEGFDRAVLARSVSAGGTPAQAEQPVAPDKPSASEQAPLWRTPGAEPAAAAEPPDASERIGPGGWLPPTAERDPDGER